MSAKNETAALRRSCCGKYRSNNFGSVNLRPSRSVRIAEANQPQRFKLTPESPDPIGSSDLKAEALTLLRPSAGWSARIPLTHRSTFLPFIILSRVQPCVNSIVNNSRIKHLAPIRPATEDSSQEEIQ
jgi:hypothetical protein